MAYEHAESWKQVAADGERSAAGQPAPTSVRFFGILSSGGNRVLFLLDGSDSMLTPLTPAEKEALRALLEEEEEGEADDVATATSCLERYEVLEPGAALVYLAEDALLTVRERVAGIAGRRGLDLRDLDLHVITAPTLRLDRAGDRDQLFEAVRRLRARLLLLDPLVRLHSADENNATEMAQILFYLRDLQRQLDLSVVLVHHTRKHVPSGAQAGQGLRGSSDLHAFGDSNLYLRRTRDGLLLSMEHRAAAAPEPVALHLVAADSSSIHLEVTALPPAPQAECKARLEDAILSALEETSAMTRGRLRHRLSVNNERLGEALAQLERDGRVQRGPDGWRRAAG